MVLVVTAAYFIMSLRRQYVESRHAMVHAIVDVAEMCSESPDLVLSDTEGDQQQVWSESVETIVDII